MERITKKVLLWKKIFTEGLDNVNEQSSWKEILLAQKDQSKEQTLQLWKKAQDEIGVFDGQEQWLLYTQPYLLEIVNILKELPNDLYGNWFGSQLPNGDACCFLRYPKLEDNRDEEIPLIDVTIVTQEQVTLNTDVFILIWGEETTKKVTIRYADKIPQEWLDEKEKSQDWAF